MYNICIRHICFNIKTYAKCNYVYMFMFIFEWLVFTIVFHFTITLI